MKKFSIFTTATLLLFVFTLSAKTYDVSSSDSNLYWKGSKVTGSYHDGSVKMKSGTIESSRKGYTGEITIDMTTIYCEDLKSKPDLRQKLEGHLKNADFFNVEKYPTAKIVIKNSAKKSDNVYTFTADLTIKNITQEITFDATVTEDSRKKVAFTADLVIDRAKWDIKYNSKSFFDIQKLGDKLIKDEVEFKVTLIATR